MGDCDLQLATSNIQTVEIANGLAIVTRLEVGPMADLYILNVDHIVAVGYNYGNSTFWRK